MTKPGVAVREVESQLARITTCLVTLSRLNALHLLAAADGRVKLEKAERSARYADLAVAVDQFARRHYQHRTPLVSWPESVRPDVTGALIAGRIELRPLNQAVRTMVGALARVIRELGLGVRQTLLAAPVEALIAHLQSAVPDRLATRPQPLPSIPILMLTPLVGRPRKVLSGPQRTRHDPVFIPSYSLLQRREPRFGSSLVEAVPYLWTVSIRETLAAELCALSGVEYDGLPLAFYGDMSKQAWDEMRHAVYYLEVALRLIPVLLRRLRGRDPLLPLLRLFRSGRARLPIPLEGNLYEAMFNATLSERLILFQMQTEAPSAARKKQQIESTLCRAHPELRGALEYDIRDEIAHARIGKTWLAHLLPGRIEQRRAIALTNRLRSVLILTSFAHHHNAPLPQLIDQCLCGELRAA